MPGAMIKGWKCAKCGHEFKPRQKLERGMIISCSKCQYKEAVL